MTRLLLLAAAVLPLAMLSPALATVSTAAELFPRPAELAPDVKFWRRIYTEVGGDGGFIHDHTDLRVVYETIKFPRSASAATRDRLVERSKRGYKDVLGRLARGKRSGLSREEKRVLGLFPAGVSNRELTAARSRLRFQLGQADKFRAGLIRSGAWREFIRTTFREMGLPEELSALPHVESSFTPYAYSRVGAAGLWQFTRPTGRRFIRVDHVVDERLDPLTATIAAARLLKQNRRTTGTWPLALTAYNHGAAGMRRAARKMGTTDIAVIARKYKSRTFGFASRNFYVSFLAALEVDQNYKSYFGPLHFDSPIDYDVVALPYYAPAQGIHRVLGIETADLKRHNPALRPSVWSGAKRIPKGHELRVPRALLSRPLSSLLAGAPSSLRFASQTRDSYHRVKRGETLSAIAARYHVSISELAALNSLRSRNRISIGQTLRLPDSAAKPAPREASNRPRKIVSPPSNGVYTVRRGDTLAGIAARFGISERSLLEWNEIPNRNRIHAGHRLRVSTPPTAAPRPLKPDGPADFTAPPSARAEFSERVDRARVGTKPVSIETERVVQETDSELHADPSDYAVASNSRIEIQATETLGHYAEWLDVRASALRAINGLAYGSPLPVGDTLLLDFSNVDPRTFSGRRREHHRALQAKFFARYEIAGTSKHAVRRGDSIWVLSQRRYGVPLWLLRQYNPDLDMQSLVTGETLTIPLLKPR